MSRLLKGRGGWARVGKGGNRGGAVGDETVLAGWTGSQLLAGQRGIPFGMRVHGLRVHRRRSVDGVSRDPIRA